MPLNLYNLSMKNKIIFASIAGMITFALSSFKSIEIQEQYTAINKVETNFDFNNQTNNQSKTSLSCTKCHDCKKDESLEYENQKSSAIDYFENLDQESKNSLDSSRNSINKEWIQDENPDNFKILK